MYLHIFAAVIRKMKIEEEIKQGRFESEQQRLMINIIFTGSQFTSANNRMFKKYNLTSQQFNVLRILRGQKGQPISVKDMEGRMLDRSSNISRLVDKLLKKMLIERITCEEDRRRVEVSITEKGMLLLEKIDEEHVGIRDLIKNAITDEEAKIASQILDKFRIINQ